MTDIAMRSRSTAFQILMLNIIYMLVKTNWLYKFMINPMKPIRMIKSTMILPCAFDDSMSFKKNEK